MLPLDPQLVSRVDAVMAQVGAMVASDDLSLYARHRLSSCVDYLTHGVARLDALRADPEAWELFTDTIEELEAQVALGPTSFGDDLVDHADSLLSLMDDAVDDRLLAPEYRSELGKAIEETVQSWQQSGDAEAAYDQLLAVESVIDRKMTSAREQQLIVRVGAIRG